jgi:hypothetical protein
LSLCYVMATTLYRGCDDPPGSASVRTGCAHRSAGAALDLCRRRGLLSGLLAAASHYPGAGSVAATVDGQCLPIGIGR